MRRGRSQATAAIHQMHATLRIESSVLRYPGEFSCRQSIVLRKHVHHGRVNVHHQQVDNHVKDHHVAVI